MEQVGLGSGLYQTFWERGGIGTCIYGEVRRGLKQRMDSTSHTVWMVSLRSDEDRQEGLGHKNQERRLKGKPSEEGISRLWERSTRSNDDESLSDGIFYWVRLRRPGWGREE